MIGRALRAQARALPGDYPLAGASLGALLLGLSIAANIPAEVASAPAAAGERVAATLDAVAAVYAAVMAAIYGSFRFTIDLRDGVVARRATVVHRWPVLIARVPATVLGGAVVALAALVGSTIATSIVGVGSVIDGAEVGRIVAVGGAAAVWGLAVGLLVRAHLTALFIAPLSLGIAMFAASQGWDAARWLPLPALVQAVGLDLAALGFDAAGSLDFAVAIGVSGAWIVAALAAGAAFFLLRDLP